MVRLKAISENPVQHQVLSVVAASLLISPLSQEALLQLKKVLTELKFSMLQENLLNMFVRKTNLPFQYRWMWLQLTGKLFMQQIQKIRNYMYLFENKIKI